MQATNKNLLEIGFMEGSRFIRRFFLLLIVLAASGYTATADGDESVGTGYDARGRLTNAYYRSGLSYRFAYDPAGNMITAEQRFQSDQDADFLPDAMEKQDACPDIHDADSDDDGISDGMEDSNQNGIVDAGETDPCNPDTDGDGIQDGTERGITTAIPDPDGAGPLKGTDTGVFQPDMDPSTVTDPLTADSDGDGVSDGGEDANHNGRVDAGETNPAVVLTRRISGTLYGADGAPFATPVAVKVYSGRTCGDLQLADATRSETGTGAYAFETLRDDSYFILAEPSGADLLPQWYSAAGDAQTCAQAQAVSLTAASVATGKDIYLHYAASITGVVLESGGAVPETDGIYVNVYAQDACTGPLVKTAPLNPADGGFAVQGLSAGTYFLKVDASAGGYQAEWWASGGDARHCSDAEAVTTAPGTPAASIDISLDKGSRISGTVYQSNGTTVVTGHTIVVEAYAENACDRKPSATALVSETTGAYTLTGLPTGAYFLKARIMGGAFIDEWWSIGGDAFNCLQADAVFLAADDEATGNDFRLDAGGAISGGVFQNDGVTPVSSPVTIAFYTYQSTSSASCRMHLVTFTQTAANGTYRQALPAGSYAMRLDPAGSDYAIVWWNTAGAVISCQSATYTNVASGSVVAGKNFTLQPGSAITGNLYDSDGFTPVSVPVQVIAYVDNPCNLNEVGRGAYDPGTGQYTIDNLGAAAYTIMADGGGTAYADEWFSTDGNAYFCFQATPIDVTGTQDVAGQDILLDTGGLISGTVYKKDGVTPIDQAVPIGIVPEEACGIYSKIKTVTPDPVTGQYAFERQGPGNYALMADPASGSVYLDEWWSQSGDAFTCQQAEVISLAPGGAQPGKDFSLDTKSTLSGTLYKPDGSTMNTSFSVRLFPADGCGGAQIASVTSSRYSGVFTFQNLAPRRYRLFVQTSYNVYAPEWYSQAGDAFTCAEASEIVIPSGENITNVNVHLNVGAKISGTLYMADGVTPVPENTTVNLYQGDPCSPQYVTSITSSAGTYEIDALAPGTYYLSTSMTYYYDRWWSPAGNAQGCQDAQPITVSSVEDVIETTDFRLEEKGTISGKVYQLDGLTPVTGTMRMYLYKTYPPCYTASSANVVVSADGSYRLRGLDAGVYAIRAYYATSDFLPAWWSSGPDDYYCTEAEAITLADRQHIDQIDFKLHSKSRIAGSVLKNDGAVIDSETVYVIYLTGETPCTATYSGYVTASLTDGSYMIPRMMPGTYFLVTQSADPVNSTLITEWWSEAGHTYDCSQADAVTITRDQILSDRNFRFYDCSNFPDRATNDDFEDAIVIAGYAGIQKTTSFCTTGETGEPDHAGLGGGAQASLWWRWTAPADESVSFNTELSTVDTVLAVYEGDAIDALALVTQNDNDDSNMWSRVAFDAQQGHTYLIAVDTVDGSRGSITLAYRQHQSLPGDVNGDTFVDLGDAILVLQALANLNTADGLDIGADVDANGRIGMAEAIFIIQKQAQMR